MKSVQGDGKLGPVHPTRSASTISAQQREARKTTSSFSKREKMRRKPFLSAEEAFDRATLLIKGAIVFLRMLAIGLRRNYRNQPSSSTVAAFPCLRKHDPSAVEGSPAWGLNLPATPAQAAHRGRSREITQRLSPFEHLRQPYESWCSIRYGICQWLVARFSKRPFHPDEPSPKWNPARTPRPGCAPTARSAIAQKRGQHALLRPPVQAHVNRGQEPNRFGSPRPFATVFGHIQYCVQHLQVTQTDIAALHWQALLDARVML